MKIPEWEQVLSAGAVAMNLIVAANAMGYATSWLTEWHAYDRRVLDALGLAPQEKLAGYVHIGRGREIPSDRPDRPWPTSSPPCEATVHYDLDLPRAERSLPHSPLKAIVAPRPIGWISAMDKAGRLNLAPYSFFNASATTWSRSPPRGGRTPWSSRRRAASSCAASPPGICATG